MRPGRLTLALLLAGAVLIAGSALVPTALDRSLTAGGIALFGALLLVYLAKLLGLLVQRPQR